MLNSSKKFVKYLDNFDKIHQKTIIHCCIIFVAEFNMYYRENNEFMYQNKDCENTLFSPPGKLVRVRSFEKSKKFV